MWPRFSILITLALAVGCQDSTNSSNSNTAASSNGTTSNGNGDQKIYQIAVIPKGTTHEFWKSVHAGAENAAKELGNVKILWKGPLLENDRDGQISVMEDFIVKKVAGICLAPLDSQALIDSVSLAHENEIPVVIFDSGLDDTSNIVTYVATKNYNGGVLAAQRMGKILDGKGNVIILRYNPGSESTTKREEGFIETIEKEFPDINILTSDEYAGTTPELSLDKAIQVLSKYKDEVDGIFAVCEPNGAGVLGALEELELAGKVKFVGFDPNADILKAMKDGHCHGIVLQDPVTMGYKAVIEIMKHINGEKNEKRIGTGEYIATPENMNTPEMKTLLEPEQFDN